MKFFILEAEETRQKAHRESECPYRGHHERALQKGSYFALPEREDRDSQAADNKSSGQEAQEALVVV